MVAEVVITTARKRGRAEDGGAGCGEESCGLLLTRLARAANRSLAAGLEAIGLRSQQFGVLHRLADAGPSSQAELAASMRIHASNLVRIIDELEGAGLVVRRRDEEDRRRQVVGVTRAGFNLLQRAERVAADTEADLLAPLSAAERAQLQGLLSRLAGGSCGR